MLDDVKRREICAILAIGGSRTMAACYVGCSLDTIARTALRDPAFADQIRKATVGCELLFLRNLQSAAQDTRRWRAVAWALERFYPDRYGRRPPRTITYRQLRQGLRQVGAGLMSDIPSAADRQRVIDRLDQMARTACRRGEQTRRRLKRLLEK